MRNAGYGDVTETCKDERPDGDDDDDEVWRLCSGVGRLGARAGDSGAPVFRLRGRNLTAQLKGIVWGYDDGGTLAYFSNYERIERDLGGMWVYDPGPPVVEYITGPRFVPRGWVCLWTSLALGMDPLHYDWSGVITEFTGTNHGVFGSPEESGWLKLEVTDILDRRAQDSTYVTVTDYVVPPVGCFPPA